MFGNNKTNVIVRDPKTRAASLNFNALMEQMDLGERKAGNAARDLERMGMTDARSTPRDSVLVPSMPDMAEDIPLGPGSGYEGGMSGLGNIHTQGTKPGERYWERWTMGRAKPMERAVAKKPPPYLCGPEQMPMPPGLEQYRQVIEQCLIPMWKRLQSEETRAFARSLESMTYISQPVTHLAPPVTALAVDLFTSAAGVTAPAAPGVPGTVLSIDVPDRFLVILDRFANGVQSPNKIGDVQWSMQRNKSPIRSYGDFDVDLGCFCDPTKLGSPIILKHKDEFRLLAQSNLAGDVNVSARMIGWAFAVSPDADGSAGAFQTH